MQVTFVAESPAMAGLLRQVDRLSAMDVRTTAPCNVVIYGETGVGKDRVARLIHERSNRKPFVALNCSAIPEELFESELFGHERGAFTGAIAAKKGLLELAAGGTLFLDEAADLPVGLQVKLLRALQNRLIRRVGGLKDIAIDVRIIAASNRDLRALIARGAFRRDLFYRLSVFPLTVPPLRERQADLEPLVTQCCAQLAEKYRLEAKRLSPAALEALKKHPWPGNVREMEHVIEHGFIVAEGDEISIADIADSLSCEADNAQPDAEFDAQERPRKETLVEGAPQDAVLNGGLQAWLESLPPETQLSDVRCKLKWALRAFCSLHLRRSRGNVSAAARTLGIDRASFRRYAATSDTQLEIGE